jgi:hypothetical protein
VAVGGTWNRDDVIVAGNTSRGLVRCPAGGGEAAAVTNTGHSGADIPSLLHLFPTFLPDGRHVLYFRVSRTDPSANGVYIADLQRPPAEQDNTRLLETGFGAKFAPNESGVGRILFIRNRGVWAVPFDADRRSLAGEPVQVTESVGTFRDGAFFDTNGSTLVFRGGLPDSQLGWRGRDGGDLGRVGEPGQYAGVALSPDGTLAAVVRENKLSRSDQDIWLVDLRRNTTTRFTSDLMPESIPAWSADGRSLIFAAGYDNADVRAKPIGGGADLTLLRGADLTGMSVNPLLTRISASVDGRWLLFNMDTRGPTRSDIWVLGLEEPRRAAPLIRQDFDQIQAMMSPDRSWLAYVSNESGVNEVLVRSLSFDPASGQPATGRPVQVSRGGGRAPRWRADGRELFFQSSSGAIMAAAVAGTAIGEPAQLFAAPGALADWGVASDGQRFLLALPAADHELPFTIVLNWMAVGR